MILASYTSSATLSLLVHFDIQASQYTDDLFHLHILGHEECRFYFPEKSLFELEEFLKVARGMERRPANPGMKDEMIIRTGSEQINLKYPSEALLSWIKLAVFTDHLIVEPKKKLPDAPQPLEEEQP